MTARRLALRGWFPGVVLVALLALPVAAADVDYLGQVRPLLKSRCVSCHGGLRQEGGLRLDTGLLARQGGGDGPVLVPGEPGKSPLIARVKSDDPDTRMPQQDKPLSAREIALLEAWIKGGARSPADEKPETALRDHWAFRRPTRPKVPVLPGAVPDANPIDAFLAAERRRRGLVPSGPARPDQLLRRVTLDLVGLPPSADRVRRFLADPGEEAYLRLVEELLGNPGHGERWGRHWMDVWRYSDWYGRRSVNDVRNSYPHIWRWRDWIIESLNNDHGYDRMVREMIAADELAPTDDTAIAATGFIVRNWFSLNYDQWMKDMVEHTGKAFLALRFNCAHCHDHKYDPISQAEYFRFRAFFEPLEFRHDRVPGGPPLVKYKRYMPGSGASLKPIAAGLPRIYDENLKATTLMYAGGDARDTIKDQPPVLPGGPAFLGGDRLKIAAIDLPPEAWNPGLKGFAIAEETARLQSEIARSLAARDKAPKPAPRMLEPLQQAVAAARKRLAAAEASPADAKPTATDKAAVVERSRLLGEWRFEGKDTGDGFLADSSGRGHRLKRVTAKPPAASPAVLSGQGPGTAFLGRLPGRAGINRQAARFQQVAGTGYLATPVTPELGAATFTVEALIHVGVAKVNFNCGIAESEGTWIWLHRGLDNKTSELRLILYERSGGRWDHATGRALTLVTGGDYYVALVVGPVQVRMVARRLGASEPLQRWKADRAEKGKLVPALASPKAGGTFKIGNSGNGTGRHQGLIDEVRYWKGVVTDKQLVARAASNPRQEAVARAGRDLAAAERDLLLARTGHFGPRARLAAARQELAAFEARVAAERARTGSNTQQQQALARAAAVAERAAVLKRAESAVLEAQVALSAARGKPAEAAKASKALATAQNRLATAKQQSGQKSSSYTPLGPSYPKQSTGRRRALALWMTAAEHPLTARVAVNHIWLRHFGRPLVETVFDFGRSGSLPTHPRLLDWLAVELVESGWSMKHLHRLIVSSRAYRMSSHDQAAARANRKKDPDNTAWWRWETRRAEAEVIRDSLLAVSDGLDDRLGGPEVDNKQVGRARRSLYFAHYPEAGGKMRFLSMFDAADPGDCYRRSTTIVPQQALTLANSPLALSHGRLLARAMWKQVLAVADTESLSPEQAFIESAFLTVLGRRPGESERLACGEFLAGQEQLFRKAPAASLRATAKGETAPSADPVIRSRESLVRVLLNHNEFVTIP